MRSAFTLVELLFVLVILGILGSFSLQNVSQSDQTKRVIEAQNAATRIYQKIEEVGGYKDIFSEEDLEEDWTTGGEYIKADDNGVYTHTIDNEELYLFIGRDSEIKLKNYRLNGNLCLVFTMHNAYFPDNKDTLFYNSCKTPKPIGMDWN